jgi:unsaturated chondroitin disaccharide hydrolase
MKGEHTMYDIQDEGIRYPQRYAEAPDVTRAYCENAIQYILQKIDANLDTFTDTFPTSASVNNVYAPMENTNWTTSFWTGMLWLAYDVTGDEKYRRIAEIHVESFKQRMDEGTHIDTHDLGFLYTLSCVAAYKLTGNQEAKDIALQAAKHLAGRFREQGQFILAWGPINTPDNPRGNRMIIDCLMNLPLLHWAADVTGDERYRTIAVTHAHQTMKHIVRPDASSFHTFYFDYETGKPLYGKTHQGHADDSAWARGQAWAIYGLPLSYRYIREWDLLDVAQKMTNYFLNRLPEDQVCYWDLVFTDGTEPRDSSAAALAVCGMLEMLKHLPVTNAYRRTYEHAALKIMQSLTDHYTTLDIPGSNGILLHATQHKPNNVGVDECNIYADYFYFEALVRLIKDWNPYW